MDHSITDLDTHGRQPISYEEIIGRSKKCARDNFRGRKRFKIFGWGLLMVGLLVAVIGGNDWLIEHVKQIMLLPVLLVGLVIAAINGNDWLIEHVRAIPLLPPSVVTYFFLVVTFGSTWLSSWAFKKEYDALRAYDNYIAVLHYAQEFRVAKIDPTLGEGVLRRWHDQAYAVHPLVTAHEMLLAGNGQKKTFGE
jgi:prepilin signal peptidase PulO-like enzyme (type II secretory pathway)